MGAAATTPAQGPRSARLGDWTIHRVSDGLFRLDGGAMWGVVPATLWRPLTPPDEDNTILLALNTFLCERGDRRVLIEGGLGRRWSEKLQGIYRMDFAAGGLREQLAAVGRAPEEVTDVVLTHCHWDHAGGLVEDTPDGPRPLFPNAAHRAPAVEIENALHPDPVRRASYRAEDLQPLLDAGLLTGYADGEELLPGVTGHILGGHSDGSSVITVDASDGARAIFWGDVVPTTHHVQPPYIMAYDVDAARSYEVRAEWLERAAEGGWLGLYYHDPEQPFGRLSRDGRRYAFTPEP